MPYLGSGICEECGQKRKRIASTFWGIFCEECFKRIRKELLCGIHEIQSARNSEKKAGDDK